MNVWVVHGAEQCKKDSSDIGNPGEGDEVVVTVETKSSSTIVYARQVLWLVDQGWLAGVIFLARLVGPSVDSSARHDGVFLVVSVNVGGIQP